MAGRADVGSGRIRAPFTGRARERDLLVGFAQATIEGQGAAVLIGGEPGMGKSRLCEEVVDAVAGEVATGVAACAPEGQGSFHVWTRALEALPRSSRGRPWADLVSAVTGILARTAAAEAPLEDLERRRRFDDALDALARHRPAGAGALLVLDDLHWADRPSLELLGHVLPALGRIPVLVVATYRPHDLARDHPVLRMLTERASAAHHLELAGLPPSDIARVAAAFAGIDSSDIDAEIVRETTGGNPLFARELARLHGDRLPAEIGSTVPGSVRPVIEHRLDLVSRRDRGLLDAMAVWGEPIQAVDLEAVVAADRRALLDGLDRLAGTGLIAATGAARWGFTHALIHQTVYDELGGSARAELHRRCAERLTAAPAASARQLAHHLVRAMPLSRTEDAAAAARAAGDQALLELAYEEAAGWFAWARGAGEPTDPEDRTALLLSHAEAQYRAGDRAAAHTTYGEAVRAARETGRADHLVTAALGYGAGAGGFEIVPLDDDQIGALRDAVDAVGPGDSPERSRVLARLSVAAALEVGVEGQRALADEALAMARRMQDPGLLAYALATHCDAYAGPDDLRTRIDDSGEMLSLSARTRDLELELLARRVRIVASLERGDLRAAEADIDGFRRAADRVGHPLFQWYVPYFEATIAMASGEFRRAGALSQEAAEIGLRADSFNAAMLTEIQRSDGVLLEGHYADAIELYLRLHGRYRAMFDHDATGEAVVGSFLALCGDLAAAGARFDRGRRAGFEIRLDSEWLMSTVTSLAGATLLGDRESAALLRERLLPHRDRFLVDGIAAGLFGVVSGWLAPASELLGLADDAAAERAHAITSNQAAGVLVVAEHLRTYGTPWRSQEDPPSGPCELLLGAGLDHRPGTEPAPRTGGPQRGSLCHVGDHWEITFDGRTVTVRDTKGVRDLASLLQRPGAELAAIDLAAPEQGVRRRVADRPADDVLDRAARAAYRERIRDLQEDLDRADADHDIGRSATLQAELDLLVHELRAATGLGGRARRTGSDAERARKAVSARINDTVRKLDRSHPALARHLRRAVRTGTFCAYEPETPVLWHVEA